jgi:hypothetical protein
MAFHPDEISTLTYSPYNLENRPSCPNGDLMFASTMTRPMTWSDLTIDCDNIEPGVVWVPGADQWGSNWYNG